ncbi:hypothetical protein [Solicola gregarius]|uniref:Uncharacterized protein n=1 Tax=Solicola gregarius TaxID=2908642 RepID=A0AA46YKP8_9ACTN|nr:hypothetical protein [Solicola gregarius]UYM06000.1 hypothetical protein L0C25_02715 [Solicola gregarius]
MRGTECTVTTDQPRPIVGRELEPTSPRPQTRRLHVDRPCYVGREATGAWTWHCSLCPLPLGLVANAADGWHAAIDEATHHLRTAHGDSVPVPAENGWLLAA